MKILARTKERFVNVIFWSVVTAAFIGPGTVTTAVQAGALYNLDLLWTFVFATIACFILQEAGARITIFSGSNLGEAIVLHYTNKKSKKLIYALVFGAIVFGCSAYEAGNIMGSVIGLNFIYDLPNWVWVMIVVLFSFISLNLRSIHSIAKFMGYLVFAMGLAFIIGAISLHPPIDGLLSGSIIPVIPASTGAGILILGLVGTTVVPYDLFLGSGVLEKTQKIAEMRFGLGVAIVFGGFISGAILVIGTILYDPTGVSLDSSNIFPAFAEMLVSKHGTVALALFGFGLFVAGLSSAITAPLASAITAKSLFQKPNGEKWKSQSRNFKIVSHSVLAVGMFFGLSNMPSELVIIVAQALNGLILPFISIFMWMVINNKKIMGVQNVNNHLQNTMMAIVVWVTMILGFNSLTTAFYNSLIFLQEHFASSDLIFLKNTFSFLISLFPLRNVQLYTIGIVTFLITLYFVFKIYHTRKQSVIDL